MATRSSHHFLGLARSLDSHHYWAAHRGRAGATGGAEERPGCCMTSRVYAPPRLPQLLLTSHSSPQKLALVSLRSDTLDGQQALAGRWLTEPTQRGWELGSAQSTATSNPSVSGRGRLQWPSYSLWSCIFLCVQYISFSLSISFILRNSAGVSCIQTPTGHLHRHLNICLHPHIQSYPCSGGEAMQFHK